METDSTREPSERGRQSKKIATYIVVAVIDIVVIYSIWLALNAYIEPRNPTHRKDLIQVMAVGLGAIGAVVTAIIGWRNLKQSQQTTERTIENTRLIEEQRGQNDALQRYFEQMGQLLTKEKLRSSGEGSDVRVLARSQTLTVLQGVSPERKQILLRFLYESHLIIANEPIVSLAGADLKGANLRSANLYWAKLLEANLREATLFRAYLALADLTQTDLNGANLNIADLEGANLEGANLEGADLNQANLIFANLYGANLEGATLNEANLYGANLEGANLEGVNLEGANLYGVSSVTQEQLASCNSLKGATMPDGSRHA